MSMRPGDGTCRGNSAAKILTLVNGPDARSGGLWTVGELATAVGRSVRYVRSIVDECEELEFADVRGSHVRDFRVRVRRAG